MVMNKYLSLPHLAEHYDLHQDTLRKRLKELDIKKDEHFIIIGKTVRYDVIKVHPLLISQEDNQIANDVLNRLLT
jgi:hypothetical protein